MKTLKYAMLTDEEKKVYKQLVDESEKTARDLSDVNIKSQKIFSWFRGGQFFFYMAKWKLDESKARHYVKSLMRAYGCNEIAKDTFPDYPYTTIELIQKNR